MTTETSAIESQRLLTVDDLAQYLGKSTSWVYKGLGPKYEPGRLPRPLRVGGQWRWRWSDVERWLDNQ